MLHLKSDFLRLVTLLIVCIKILHNIQSKIQTEPRKSTNILSESQTENYQITLVYMKKEQKNEE